MAMKCSKPLVESPSSTCCNNCITHWSVRAASSSCSIRRASTPCIWYYSLQYQSIIWNYFPPIINQYILLMGNSLLSYSNAYWTEQPLNWYLKSVFFFILYKTYCILKYDNCLYYPKGFKREFIILCLLPEYIINLSSGKATSQSGIEYFLDGPQSFQ